MKFSSSVKITKSSAYLLVLPVVSLLASCGQPQITVPSTDNQLVSEKQTEAPKDFVVYPDDRPSVPDGKLVYAKMQCASCHGADGSGGNGPALNDTMKMSAVKPVDLYKHLTYGEKEQHHMLGKISNRDVWNLVFYTRSLSVAPLTQAELDDILPTFGANCAVCHGTKGDGDGPLARNLEPWPANFTTFRRFYDRTDDVLFDHIANGIKWEGMPNFLGKEDKKKNVKFDHAYIKKLVQYVRNFHMSGEPTVASAATDAGSTPGAATTPPPGGNEAKGTTGETPSGTAEQAETKNGQASPVTPEGGKPTGTVTPHTAPDGTDVNKEGKEPTGGNVPSKPGPTAAPPQSAEKGNQPGQEKGNQSAPGNH